MSRDPYSGQPFGIAGIPLDAAMPGCFTVPSSWPTIDVLCLIGVPFNVERFITFSVINSLLRQPINGAPPNVLEPAPKVLVPFLIDCDPPSAIVAIAGIIRIVAPLSHG